MFPTEGAASEKTLMGERLIIVVKENLPVDSQVTADKRLLVVE